MTTVPPVTTSQPSENVKRLGLASTTGAVKSWRRSAKSKSTGPVRVMRTAGRARLSSTRLDVEAEERRERDPAERAGRTRRKPRGHGPAGAPSADRLTANRPVNRLSSTRSMLVWRPLSSVSLSDGHAPHDLGQRPQQRANQQREDKAQRDEDLEPATQPILRPTRAPRDPHARSRRHLSNRSVRGRARPAPGPRTA